MKIIAVVRTRKIFPRFFNKVDFDGPVMPGMETPCWVWTGAIERGYGRFWFEGRNCKAYRMAFELLKGPIPAHHEPDHVCFNKACVNPDHLEAVTRRVNSQRYRATITRCPNGHPYKGDNLYVRPRGERECVACRRESRRKYRHKRKETSAA